MLNMKVLGVGPALVMLHGWGFYSGIFEEIATVLSKTYRVILIDLPGFGHSVLSSPQDYEFNTLLTQLNQSVDQPAYWLGWSMGGLLTLGMALHHPEKVLGLIQVATSPCIVEREDWPGISLKAFSQAYEGLKTDYLKTMQQFIALQVFQSENYKQQLEKIKKTLAAVPTPSEMTLKVSLEFLKKTDLRKSLPQIHCPILMILGKLDALIPVKIQSLLMPQLPQATFSIFPHAGHLPFLVDAEKFISEIRNFIK